MDNAELYRRSNALQRRDTLDCLDKHGNRIHWKEIGERVIDLGCADGSVTNVLKMRIPENYERLLGCDVSENMVKYATEHYGSSRTMFRVLDLENSVTEDLKRSFDHVFSFYTIHWIRNQERAFQNVYDLLDSGGECLLLFLGNNPIFDVYRRLSRTDKWKSLLSHVENFISPYHDDLNPETKIESMMNNIGFTVDLVQCQTKSFVFDDLDLLRRSVSAVNPFNISKELMPSFLDDYVDIVRDMGLIDETVGKTTIRCSYTVINVFAKKI